MKITDLNENCLFLKSQELKMLLLPLEVGTVLDDLSRMLVARSG
jgi:hypothetical protein